MNPDIDPGLAPSRATVAGILESLAAAVRREPESSRIELATLPKPEACHDGDAARSHATRRPNKSMSETNVNAPTKPSPILLTSRETAELFRVDVRTLRRMWRAGAIPAPIQIGRSIRWRRREVEKWIEDQVAR